MRQPVLLALLMCSIAVCGCDSARFPVWETKARAESNLSVDFVTQENVQFVRGYSQGCAKAGEIGKPMLVFFSASESVFCTEMLNEAFTDETVVNLSGKFVCVMVDADEEPEVCQAFRVEAYPTIQFMSPRGVPLNRLTGKRDADQFAEQMRAAMDAIAYRMDRSRETTIR